MAIMFCYGCRRSYTRQPIKSTRLDIGLCTGCRKRPLKTIERFKLKVSADNFMTERNIHILGMLELRPRGGNR